jgi:hypothetical protein
MIGQSGFKAGEQKIIWKYNNFLILLFAPFLNSLPRQNLNM